VLGRLLKVETCPCYASRRSSFFQVMGLSTGFSLWRVVPPFRRQSAAPGYFFHCSFSPCSSFFRFWGTALVRRYALPYRGASPACLVLLASLCAPPTAGRPSRAVRPQRRTHPRCRRQRVHNRKNRISGFILLISPYRLSVPFRL
jgi:hypothetical protein